MKYLLSVDGGGTKTKFCISNVNGDVVGTVTTGSSSIKSVGEEKAYEELSRGVKQLTEIYHITPDNLPMSVFGMSGCDSDSDYEVILKQILNLGFSKENIYICNDGVLAFYAQIDAPGIVVISGTGSIVIGIDKQGQIRRSGGWGYNFSDIGSGYWIGCEILKKVLLYCDECHPYARIFEQIKKHLQVAEFEKLPYQITNLKNSNEIAEFAYGVVTAAEKGDDLAVEILKDGARHLACQAEGMFKKMKTEPGELRNIVFSGGVLQSSCYQNLLAEEIKTKLNDDNVQFYMQKEQPSYGGIKLAKTLLDRRLDSK